MKIKLKQRFVSLLLCAAMLVSLCPQGVLAVEGETNTGKAIQLGTGGITGYSDTNSYDYIYFGSWEAPDNYTKSGPIKWRVLDDQTSTGEKGLFLLSDIAFGTGLLGDVYFDSSGNSNAWQGSDAQAWCKDFAGEEGAANKVTDAFTAGELGAVLATTKSDREFTSSTNGVRFSASGNILNGDKVFFLSAEEVENEAYGFPNDAARVVNYGTRSTGNSWWLRSPVYFAIGNDAAGMVQRDCVYFDDMDKGYAARPAFNLDLNAVLFTSAADNSGHISFGATIPNYSGSEWKVTLKDGNDFSSGASMVSATTSFKAGTTLTINHAALSSLSNEYTDVTAALTDASGKLRYYGSINSDTSATESTVTIPANLPEGTYTLSIYGEDRNDAYRTDYATGTPYTVTITVDNTPPGLSAYVEGAVSRTSDTEATVKFTSHEAGTYYYIVVDSGANAPDIDTTGAGTACDTTEQTISLTLTAGAKDIYIVAKDAAGNVSDALQMAIPAYIERSYDIYAFPGTLDFGRYEVGYGTIFSQTITVANTGTQNVTVALPASENYTITAETGFTNDTADLAPGGTAKFTVTPKTGLAVRSYNETLSISGSNDTSASVQLVFAVTDNTPPVLSAGTATRDSDTTATVTFTSSETGTYYYEVVERGAAAPEIDATWEGTPCDTTEQTISLADLMVGAKDIYIVVKDAAGNVSDPLKITIPAWTLPAPTGLAWDLNSEVPGRITWSGVTGASGYAVQLYKDGVAEDEVVSVTEAECYFDITEAGSYTFAVQATGGDAYAASEWSKPSEALHTVSFVTNCDPVVPMQLVADNGLATAPSGLEKAGYVFAGWYSDANFSEESKWDFASSTVTQTTTLYAKWKWLSSDTSVTAVSVDGTAGTIDGTTITVELPHNTTPPTDSGKIGITVPDGASKATPTTSDNGATWTFTVTAENGSTKKTYTINVSVDSTHTYGESWKSDADNHWHECSCGAKAGEAEHEYDDEQDTTCNVCGYVRTVAPVTYTLTVDLAGGSGGTTSGQYAEGAVIQIDAGARTGYRFSDWTSSNGGSFADTSSASTTFTMPAAGTTITANWLSTDAGVTAVSVDNTEGEIKGDRINVVLPLGTSSLPTDSSAVSITPATGATVSNLTLAENDGSKWTFTVTAEDGEATENYTINVSVAEDPAAGNIADLNAAKSTLEAHTWTVLQATANTEADVKAWVEKQLAAMSLNGASYEVTMTDGSFNAATEGGAADRDGMDGSFAFTVKLSKGTDTGDAATGTYAETTVTISTGAITAAPYTKWTITVNAGNGGTVSGGGTFEENAQVTVTAAPNSGYKFVRWEENGSEVSTSAAYTFTVTSDRILTAVFEPDAVTPTSHSITVQTEGSGTASASPTSATAGTTIKLTVTPNSGYHFKEWQVISGGVAITDNTFTMPAGNVTVKAIFEANQAVEPPEEDIHKIVPQENFYATDADIPEALREKDFTVETIKQTLVERLGSNVEEDAENVAFYDVRLMIWTGRPGEQGTWREATEDDFPVEGGLLVTLPYPEQLADSWAAYDFTVAHMLAAGDKAGTVEIIAEADVQKTAEGLQFTVNSLSPFAVSWNEPKAEPARPAETSSGDTEALIGAAVVIGGGAALLAYHYREDLPIWKLGGVVVLTDETAGAALPAANAAVELYQNGQLVKTLTTDADGRFAARLPKGTYEAVVTWERDGVTHTAREQLLAERVWDGSAAVQEIVLTEQTGE